jgi:hypothetical protein
VIGHAASLYEQVFVRELAARQACAGLKSSMTRLLSRDTWPAALVRMTRARTSSRPGRAVVDADELDDLVVTAVRVAIRRVECDGVSDLDVGVEVVWDLPSDIPSAPIRPRRLAAAMAARMRRS